MLYGPDRIISRELQENLLGIPHHRLFVVSLFAVGGLNSLCRCTCFECTQRLPMCPCHLAMPYMRSAVIGEVDEVEDSNKDLSSIMAEPLKPVTH